MLWLLSGPYNAENTVSGDNIFKKISGVCHLKVLQLLLVFESSFLLSCLDLVVGLLGSMEDRGGVFYEHAAGRGAEVMLVWMELLRKRSRMSKQR